MQRAQVYCCLISKYRILLTLNVRRPHSKIRIALAQIAQAKH